MMRRKMKKIIAGVGVLCQILTMMVYSFGEPAAPKYYYLLVWGLCAVLIRCAGYEEYTS